MPNPRGGRGPGRAAATAHSRTHARAQIVFAVLAGWAVVINVGRAAFSGGPKKEAAK